MNRHLKLVREFHDKFSSPQANHGGNSHLSEQDIIMRQALLMEEGSEILKAIKAGDMVEMLAGVIDLAYCALGAIAVQGADVLERPVSWQEDGSIISLMRLFSDKINNCASGRPDRYSELYCLCVHLSSTFINADFDRAFQMAHVNKMSCLDKTDKCDNAEEIKKSKSFKIPNLSDCFFE